MSFYRASHDRESISVWLLWFGEVCRLVWLQYIPMVQLLPFASFWALLRLRSCKSTIVEVKRVVLIDKAPALSLC